MERVVFKDLALRLFVLHYLYRYVSVDHFFKAFLDSSKVLLQPRWEGEMELELDFDGKHELE